MDQTPEAEFAENVLRILEEHDVDLADGLDAIAMLLRTQVMPALIGRDLTEAKARKLAGENALWEAVPHNSRRTKWLVIQGTARQRKKLKRELAKQRS